VFSSRGAPLNGPIVSGQLVLGRFTWAQSGRYLFFEGLSEQVKNLWRVAVEPATAAWLSAERLTTGAGPDGDITVSPDGVRLMFSARSTRTRLWAYPFDSGSARILGPGEPVTSGGGAEQDAESPADGTKLVYSRIRGGRQEFWERSLADGRERLLLSSAGWKLTRPRWSHDGQQLAYFRRPAAEAASQADFAVMVLPIDGRERTLTRPGQIHLIPSDWSADGASLLGSCRTGTPVRIGACVLPVFDGVVSPSALRVIASDPGKNIFEARFSPNQRWISFIAVDRADARVSRIHVVPAAGGGWRAVTDGLWYDDKPHWSRDGRLLYFLSDRSGMFNLWARRFDPDTGTSIGEPFQITSFGSPQQTISAELSRNQIAITSTQVFLPITESAGELWMLDNVDR
jgi:Tol biopolymer transport system component